MDKFKIKIKFAVFMLIALSSFVSQSEVLKTADPISAQKKPNIVIIYSDDQGWGDVGYHGYSDIRTPNIIRYQLKAGLHNSGRHLFFYLELLETVE